MDFQNLARETWCNAAVKDAVERFHRMRGTSTDAIALGDLAKLCADKAFQSRVKSIMGDKELTAQMFFDKCIERFTQELSQLELDMETGH